MLFSAGRRVSNAADDRDTPSTDYDPPSEGNIRCQSSDDGDAAPSHRRGKFVGSLRMLDGRDSLTDDDSDDSVRERAVVNSESRRSYVGRPLQPRNRAAKRVFIGNPDAARRFASLNEALCSKGQFARKVVGRGLVLPGL